MKHPSLFVLILLAGLLGPARAELKQWTGTGDWTSSTNWTPNGAPGATDDVLLATGSVRLADAATMQSLVVSNGATLTFTNWNTVLEAVDVTVLSNGVITCSGPFTTNDMSNRVWIVCTNLTVRERGQIHADARGFKAGFGPSPGNPSSNRGSGGGHGGKGGDGGTTAILGGYPCDAPAAPVQPGSGGGAGSSAGSQGGGAIRIQASGEVTVHGTLSANGAACPNQFGGAGAGGAVFITCRTLAGTNGLIRANGGSGFTYNQNGNGGEGGGGRIAVAYDPAAQAELPVPVIVMQALGGRGNTLPQADLGTIALPDAMLLTDQTLNNFSGQMLGFSQWTGAQVTLTTNWIRFPADGFALTVSSNLTLSGSSRLELGGDSYLPPPQATLYGYLPGIPARYVYHGGSNGTTLSVGGNLLLTNSASLFLFSAPTNSPPPDYGAWLTVNGSAVIATGACLYPVAHPTNGGAPLLRFGTLTLLPQGAIRADSRGFPFGFGTGRSLPDNQRAGGAGHGGQGGKGVYGALGGITYGNADTPLTPGSPPGKNTYVDFPPRWGGGVIRIDASRIWLNGTISAGAEGGDGGSGGSIWITATRFGGAGGTLAARGGTPSDITRAGGGGGGRIAVWRGVDDYQGAYTADVSGGNGYQPGTNGTTAWNWLPLPGTLILVK